MHRRWWHGSRCRRRRWRWTRRGGKNLRPGIFAGLCDVSPLEQGPDLGEGRRGPHHGDEGSLLFEAIGETDEQDVDQLPIVNRITKFPKLVGDGLEALAVDTDMRIALHGVAKLGVETVDPSVDVVLEELSEGRP